MEYSVTLQGGKPWGIRLTGGLHKNQQVKISAVRSDSEAYRKGIQMGDFVECINNRSTMGLSRGEVLQMMNDAQDSLHLQCRRSSCHSDGFTSSDEQNGSTHSFTDGEAETPSDDTSASTSDSQSSIIQVVDGKRHHVAKKCRRSTSLPPSSSQESKSSSFIWAPFGEGTETKPYRPVSFTLSTSSTAEVEPVGRTADDLSVISATTAVSSTVPLCSSGHSVVSHCRSFSEPQCIDTAQTSTTKYDISPCSLSKESSISLLNSSVQKSSHSLPYSFDDTGQLEVFEKHPSHNHLAGQTPPNSRHFDYHHSNVHNSKVAKLRHSLASLYEEELQEYRKLQTTIEKQDSRKTRKKTNTVGVDKNVQTDWIAGTKDDLDLDRVPVSTNGAAFISSSLLYTSGRFVSQPAVNSQTLTNTMLYNEQPGISSKTRT